MYSKYAEFLSNCCTEECLILIYLKLKKKFIEALLHKSKSLKFHLKKSYLKKRKKKKINICFFFKHFFLLG